VIPRQPSVAATAPIYLEVVVPNPNARVWVDDQATTRTGTVRDFTSPPVAVGSSYSYDVRASWKENGHQIDIDRHVSVVPGESNRIEFTTGGNVISPVSQ
jgi:uncharacterized protein (TIGR03000 family)